MAENPDAHYPVMENKTALITGAGQGLGEAMAHLFARSGAQVVVSDLNEETGRKVVEAIKADGGEATFIKANVADSADVQRLIDETIKVYGKLDAAVNNAARAPDQAPVTEMDEDYWEDLMAVDLKGVAVCMKYELRQMIAQGGGGSIVNISSVSGYRPQPGNIAYVAAKHGVIGMTKVAALENGVHDIRVNAVAPGTIDTPMLHEALEKIGADKQEFADQLSLLGRFGTPREIGQAALWLASDQASYVTGSTIHADAGYSTGR